MLGKLIRCMYVQAELLLLLCPLIGILSSLFLLYFQLLESLEVLKEVYDQALKSNRVKKFLLDPLHLQFALIVEIVSDQHAQILAD